MKDERSDELPVIYQYTRQEAIADGVLIDLTEWAQETGFKFPVAVTAAVWHDFIVPHEKLQELGQSERGRAHDMLWMLFNAIRGSDGAGSAVHFEVLFLQYPQRQQKVRLKSHCGPGDNGEPVITIMLPHED